jgi:hypothetical protein
VLEFGSLAVINAEEKSPEANITTASDALWAIPVLLSPQRMGSLLLA